MTVDIATAVQEAGSVRKATEDEIPRVAAVLAQAFFDDPQLRGSSRTTIAGAASSAPAFELFLRRVWFAQDECYTTASRRWRRGLGTTRRVEAEHRQAAHDGAGDGARTSSALPRLIRAITKLESNHPDEPHYYLPFVGVAPEWQGRGVGAALMARSSPLRRGIHARVPRGVEPANRMLYERHGFVVTEEFRLAKDAPPLWRMWRIPAGQA